MALDDLATQGARASAAMLLCPRPTKLEGGYTGFTLSVRPSVCPSVCRRHGFRSISQVCFGISISNFIRMLMVVIGRCLLIFSDVTFKMAAWRPYWIYWFPDSLLRLWISTSNCSGTILMYMASSLLIFSNVIFKMAVWRPYWIFRFLDSVGGMVSGVVSRSLLIFSNITFKMAAWWPYWIFWFPDSNFSLALNINSKLKWHNTYVYV